MTVRRENARAFVTTLQDTHNYSGTNRPRYLTAYLRELK